MTITNLKTQLKKLNKSDLINIIIEDEKIINQLNKGRR